MAGWKRVGIYIGLLLIMAAGVTLLFWRVWEENINVLTDRQGEGDYLLATYSHAYLEDWVCVLGRVDGEYRVVVGDEAGHREEMWKLSNREIPENSEPACLYQAKDGSIYLGLYELEEAKTTLQLFRITDKGRSAELLLNETCTGNGLQQQKESLRLGSFTEVDGLVTFALIRGNTASFYRQASGTDGLALLQEEQAADLRNALALIDGRYLLVTGNSFIPVGGGKPYVLPEGQTVARSMTDGISVNYVEGSSLQLCSFEGSALFENQPGGTAVRRLALGDASYEGAYSTDLTPLSSTKAVFLMDGRHLFINAGGSVSDISGMLSRPMPLCILSFALGGLCVLAVSTLLWFILCEQRQFYLPLMARWGFITVVLALLGLGILVRFAVIPAGETATQREVSTQVNGVISMLSQDGGVGSPEYPENLRKTLSGNALALYQDVRVALYSQNRDGTWSVAAANDGTMAGGRGELVSGFNQKNLEKMQKDGTGSWQYQIGGVTRYVIGQTQGSNVLTVDVNGMALQEQARDGQRWMVRQSAVFAGLFVLLTLLILGSITRNLRRVTAGMERMSEGNYDEPVVLNSADELASLADGLNTLSGSMMRTLDRQEKLNQSYHRFVPEQILSFLEKGSIMDVDKQSFVSRNLAAMMLSFQFPPEVYEKSGQALFDNINEVIERTAPIVTRRGGTVFNFDYDKYDAVFEAGSAAAVGAAVEIQQELIEINREHRESGRPAVDIYIALDEGNVMIGVIGDKNQIEVDSISSSFSVGRHLLELGQKLQARILCTEVVMRGSRSYNSRYMGRCIESGEEIRTYEIFDGDPYEVRKHKEASSARFSEGVYALYGQDYSRAKRIFLDLVHENAGDGGARYYLYLADRLEKHPDERVSLDIGVM